MIVHSVEIEPACATSKRMAASKRFVFFFCGRGKVGGGNNRLLHNESFESCLPCVTFCFINCQTFRLLTRRLSSESVWPPNLRLCV